MSTEVLHTCILLPCSATRLWAVPQTCLGEIVTVAAADDGPPPLISWRGESIPVVDFGADGDPAWRDPRTGSGLIAVMLGFADEPCHYWGVALRGSGLGVAQLGAVELEDLPDAVQDHASAAFRLHDTVYQVPDLLAIQRTIGEGGLTARERCHAQQLEQ